MFYDIEKIKDELKPINVILYLSVRYKRRGKNIYIICPDHKNKTGRADQHIGNCILGNTFYNAYYCFGCGAKGDCFELIASLENLDFKKDFTRILEIASEACGGKELFTSQSKNYFSKNEHSIKEKNLNGISKDQLKLIGLDAQHYPYIFTEFFSNQEGVDDNGFIKDSNYNSLDKLGLPSISYLSQKYLNYSINTVLNNSEDAYSFIVKNKAMEAMEKYRDLSNKNWRQLADSIGLIAPDNLDYFCERLKNVYKNKYLEAESIWKMFATYEELDALNNSWVFGYDEIIKKKPGAIL